MTGHIHVHQPTASRGGFSFLEIMIALAVLAVVMTAVAASTASLNVSHRVNWEMAKVREISQLLAERLMGSSWDTLGTRIDNLPSSTDPYPGFNGWSWHRRATPNPLVIGSPFFGPLEEMPVATANEPDPASRSLMANGLIAGPTSIANLKVYLEYYQMALFDDLRVLTTDPVNPRTPTQAWRMECGDPRSMPAVTMAPLSAITIQEQTGLVNLATINPAVAMRILVTWTSNDGGQRWHELVLARRK